MTKEDTQVMELMVRTLDSWFLLSPNLTHDAVLAWLESVKPHEDVVLDAEFLNER